MYSCLHAIGQSHPEFGDTESQEILGWTLNHHFIYGPSTDPLPQCYGLTDREANMAVGEAVARFLTASLPAAELEDWASPNVRFAVLQERCFTRAGGAPYDYDEFTGHAEELPPDYAAPTFIDIYAGPDYPGAVNVGDLPGDK
jgi:hypothetical protein